MSEKTKMVRLKCICSQVFDTYGEVVLRVPVDVTEQEIRELGGERGVDWRFLPWDQVSQPELSSRAEDPYCIDIPSITEVSEDNIEPHGVVIRSDIGPAAVVGLQWELSDERKVQIAAYNSVRTFKELSPQERKAAAERIDALVDTSYSRICKIYGEYCDRNEESPDCLWSASYINSEVFTLARRLSRKKMKYHQFCKEVADQVKLLEYNYNERDSGDTYQELLADNLASITTWFSQCEIPGNKELAQKAEQDVIEQHFRAEHGVERSSDEGKHIRRTQLLALLEQVKKLPDFDTTQAGNTECDLPQ
jgi:hypothetical protein